ncbi:MAG: hypothetical protein AAB874_05810 [Patescibacteria group bacterium]
MLNSFKKKKPTKELIEDQVSGGQSILFRIFQEIFKESAGDVRKKELTYFALAVFSYVNLRLARSSAHEKETLTDQVALDVLRKSLPYFGENISTKEAISKYQKRYKEYDALINAIFKENEFDDQACITLTLHLYESVMGKSANKKMLEVYAASPVIAQYVMDHIEFVKKKI